MYWSILNNNCEKIEKKWFLAIENIYKLIVFISTQNVSKKSLEKT